MQCEEKIKFVNGDDIVITFTVHKNGQLVSLDGSIIKFMLSYYGSDECILVKNGEPTHNKGEFVITLVPADTNGYVGNFEYQVEITDITGKKSTPVCKQLALFKRIVENL